MTDFTHRKARDIGDILTDTFQYIRLHYKTLGKGLIYFVLPVYLVYSFVMKDYANNFFSALFSSGETPDLSGIFGWEYFAGIALSMLATALLSVITLKHISLTDQDIEPTPENLIDGIAPVVMRYLILFFLMFFALLFASFLFLIPAIFLGIKWSLAPSALVIRGSGVTEALGESWELTKDHWWPTFGLFIMMYVITIFSTYVVVLPATILQILTIDSGTVTDESTFANLMNVIMALSTAVSSLFTAILHIAFALQFYNLLERKEGGSLRSKIEELAD